MTISKTFVLCSALSASFSTLYANEQINLDTLSVTATKIATGTKEISQSIAVVDEKTIEDKNILNIQDAIDTIPGVQAESSSNSQSPRLIIRGAGLKARYGVREIMVMKDGVPMTDPDSFTRFDYIDMQDVQSVEVQKGPGSINAVNATGGVVQLVTKSVFDEDKNRIKIGVGNDGQRNINLKVREALDENDFISGTFSYRNIDNDWRDNNKFNSTQGSIKYGHIFGDDSFIEGELSYTESNVELPASMTQAEFDLFKETGKQSNTSSMWQHSARDSKIVALNIKYEKEIGDITYKPRFYMNKWEHFHPVTGSINDSNDNVVYGTDLEINFAHKLLNNDASLVGGVTYKIDETKDAKKYAYADFETQTTVSWSGPVTTNIATLSDNIGELVNTEDAKTKLYGLYMMETFSPSENLSIDLSARADKLSFNIKGNEIKAYDWSSNDGSFTDGDGLYFTSKSYTLLSSKIGATYKLSDTTNIYTTIARANQAPTGSEMQSAVEDGINLDKTESINYEVGVKTRTNKLAYDIAIYQNNVDDEIIQIKNALNDTVYSNAGQTEKKGLEFNAAYKVTERLTLGGAYAYSNYKYKNFVELDPFFNPVTKQMDALEFNRSGNHLPYIPKNQYSLFLAYNMENGLKTRISTKSWGSYYMDNANSEKYEGYDLVTDLMVGYEEGDHNVQLNIKNITNEYYAMQVEKDLDGVKTYKAAAPRSFMLTYSYKF
jgi:iron complex outermembrane receptor protein